MIGWSDSPGTWVGAEVPTHLHRSPARTSRRVALVMRLVALGPPFLLAGRHSRRPTVVAAARRRRAAAARLALARRGHAANL